MNIAQKIGFLLAVPAVLLSCAVTAGTTFQSAVQAESSEPQTSETETPYDPGETPVFSLTTDPTRASVWLGGDYIGTTPVAVDELDPGTYSLRIEKDGYYTVRRWVEIDPDTSLALDIDLEQITGYLLVDSTPASAEVLVDGNSVPGGMTELPVGRHTVRVRFFGYTEQTFRVEIDARSVTRLAAVLQPAPFELTQANASRTNFNPGNPGATGFVRVTFSVSAPGRGIFEVIGPDGRTVESFPLDPFTTWEQSVRWPREGSQKSYSDGPYLLEINGIGSDGRSQTQTVAVTVDSTLIVRYRTIWNSTAGLLYAALPAPLPPGNIQVSLTTAGVATEINGMPVARFPVRLAARVGIARSVELAAHGTVYANSAPTLDRLSAGASVIWTPLQTTAGPLRTTASLAGGGTYRTPNTEGLYSGSDTLTDFPGWFGSIPLSLSLGRFSIALTPELRIAPARVHYGADLPANAWTPYLYGRAGIGADLRVLTLGLSAVVRTAPLTEAFAVELPFQAGAELHWTVPNSSIILSGFAAGEFESARDFYVMGGGGLSLLF